MILWAWLTLGLFLSNFKQMICYAGVEQKLLLESEVQELTYCNILKLVQCLNPFQKTKKAQNHPSEDSCNHDWVLKSLLEIIMREVF